ncbi:MAG: prenyltransferase [Candidatus Omnitrophica bacterium]|nr:prenyltransferase [Candidatus Omnitrophota bacterium]
MGRIIRYRFFLWAGLLPYLLGQAIAFNTNESFSIKNFWLGFLGILLVLIGVELFNEYFDFKFGGDRIFSLKEYHIPDYFFTAGITVFIFAFFIGLYLTFQTGWLILLFSFLGFLGAYFYVGPPIRWAYRGFGEIVIGLCYGPGMVLGSYYLQIKRIDFTPIFISLICGLSTFNIALLNEIPDYYQDKLVGKRNLVVKLGREKALKLLRLSLISLFFLLGFGIVLNRVPLSGMLVFLLLPLVLKNLILIQKNYENPKIFISSVNANITTYFLIIFLLGIGYLK